MTEDPGKTRATYAALLFLLIIYGGGYFFARINDWIVIEKYHIQTDNPAEAVIYEIKENKTAPISKPLLYFYKPLTFIEIEIRKIQGGY